MPSPFMIAVSGGSGAGKTTFVKNLWNQLETQRPLVISLDDYYRDLSHLSPAERAKQNFDDPEAIERDLLHEQVSLLRNGVPVERPCYDFATHTRTGLTERLVPSSIIIVDGIFSLYYPELVRLFDLKIFLSVDNDIRVLRRVGRDMEQRGRSFEKCREQYLGSVKMMYERYIEPTQKSADFIIPWHQFNERSVSYLASIVQTAIRAREH